MEISGDISYSLCIVFPKSSIGLLPTNNPSHSFILLPFLFRSFSWVGKRRTQLTWVVCVLFFGTSKLGFGMVVERTTGKHRKWRKRIKFHAEQNSFGFTCRCTTPVFGLEEIRVVVAGIIVAVRLEQDYR
jgi:hypothetical protein